MMRLIVGCGYLGKRVASRWISEGSAVHAVTRSSERALDFRRTGIEPVLCDVLDPVELRRLPAMDVILYAVGWDRASGKSMREVYVEGLLRTLDALAAPRRFIYVSSTSVYGQTTGEWVDETSQTAPIEESGKTVLEAEQVLRQRLPSAVVLRFAGIYGPGRLLRRAGIESGEPIMGNADKWLNLIHVDDGVRAIQAAETKGDAGATINVCDDGPVTRREFFSELALLLGAPSPEFRGIPAGAPLPPHELANRRIRNGRMKRELDFALGFPTYRVGLPDAVARS